MNTTRNELVEAYERIERLESLLKRVWFNVDDEDLGEILVRDLGRELKKARD